MGLDFKNILKDHYKTLNSFEDIKKFISYRKNHSLNVPENLEKISLYDFDKIAKEICSINKLKSIPSPDALIFDTKANHLSFIEFKEHFLEREKRAGFESNEIKIEKFKALFATSIASKMSGCIIYGEIINRDYGNKEVFEGYLNQNKPNYSLIFVVLDINNKILLTTLYSGIKNKIKFFKMNCLTLDEFLKEYKPIKTN